MLLLSRLIGRPVRDRAGATVGRLADLTVRLDGSPVVERLLLRFPGGRTALLPWNVVEGLHSGRLVLAGAAAGGAGPDALAADEILVHRDVLDTQIVDVAGQRLARVADVVLGRTRDGRLELLGVEVGFGAVLRRLGLPLKPVAGDIVGWPDLHLTSERGHAVQLSTPRAAVHRLDARALATLVSRVDTDAATEILAANEPAVAAGAVSSVHPEVGERMLLAMTPAQADRIVAAMPAERAGHWRDRLAHRPRWRGRRFLRHRVWPHRRHLIRDRHR